MTPALPNKWQYNTGVGSLNIPLCSVSTGETVLQLSTREMGCSDLLKGSKGGIRIWYE